MKNYMMILLVSILLTRCYSYKKVDLQQAEFKIGDKYGIHRIEQSTQKGKFQSINDTLIVLQDRRGEMHEISLNEIEKIKKRKFALGKTIIAPFGAFLIFGVAGTIIDNGGV